MCIRDSAYSAAKAELLTGGITKLHGCFLDFVTTLHGLAIDPKAQPNARVSASREGIAALYRGIEIFDFEERLRKLLSLIHISRRISADR